MTNYKQLINMLSEAQLDPAGCIMSSAKEVFALPMEQQEDIKLSLIIEAFNYHYNKNLLFRKICDEKNVKPEDITSIQDVVKVPAISIRKFKEVNSHVLLTKPIQELEHELRSTGTSGIPSISRRDDKTITRTVHSIYAMFREMFGFFEGSAVFLSPSAEDMPEMGLVKLINMFSGLLDSTRFFVHDSLFDPQAVVEQLQNWQNVHTRHLIGPPFLVERLAQYVIEQGIELKLDRRTKVITLGGWRSFTGREIIPESFRELVAQAFQINEGQIRDMFGLVETNFMAIECDHHSKHVPPWVHFSVRDLDDPTREVPPGVPGLLVVYDPSSLSYPGFIVTDDMVYLSKEPCGCGRHGQVVNYMYRIKGAEVGCCAINLEKYMSDKEAAVLQCSIADVSAARN